MQSNRIILNLFNLDIVGIVSRANWSTKSQIPLAEQAKVGDVVDVEVLYHADAKYTRDPKLQSGWVCSRKNLVKESVDSNWKRIAEGYLKSSIEVVCDRVFQSAAGLEGVTSWIGHIKGTEFKVFSRFSFGRIAISKGASYLVHITGLDETRMNLLGKTIGYVFPDGKGTYVPTRKPRPEKDKLAEVTEADKGYEVEESMPSDPAMIDTLMQQFQHLHLVCKREQRAGKTDYERPLDNIRVACSCITADGSRLVASQFMHPATDVRGLSLPMLDETSAYGLTVANFLMVAFARTNIPVENLDPYYKTIEIHFPKFKYIREYADDFGNTSVSPGRIIFPSRVMESTGLKTRRKACIFTSQLLGYNTALISADKFEKTRKHILEMARWSANREKGKAEEYEVVETAVFVAVENMAGAIKIRDDLVALLESGDVEHVYVTTEAAVDEFCIKRRCVLQAALIELRRDPVTGEYKYKSPDATFFR